MSGRIYLAVSVEDAAILAPLSLLGAEGHAPALVDGRVLLPFDEESVAAVVDAADGPLDFLDAVAAEALCPPPRSPLEGL